MRCRSAIPAPLRRFRRTPGWRRRKCIGGITAITVGIAGTVIIAITIIVTGAAGNCDSLAQHRTGPLHRGPVSIRWSALNRRDCCPLFCHLDRRRGVRHEELDRSSLCRWRARGCRPAAISPAAAAPQAKAQSAGISDAPISARTAMPGATIVITAISSVLPALSTTVGRSTIGRIPIHSPAPFTFGIGFGPLLVNDCRAESERHSPSARK